MTAFRILITAIIIVALQAPLPLALAREATLPAKQFPTGYFYRQPRESLAAKERILDKIDATLQDLRENGYGLIAKGVVLEKLGTEAKVYRRLTIMDASGLIIVAHNVPNIYYNYHGARAINPNIYLIVKNTRVNVPESYIRSGYVVEGEYVAYAQRFVDAVIDSMLRGGPMNYRENPNPKGLTARLAGGP